MPPLDAPPLRVYTQSVPNSSERIGGDGMAELSVPEVARHLGVSETIVRRLVGRGELVPVRIAVIGQQTRRYFDADVVEALRRKRAGEDT